MLSDTAEYALRALLYLALREEAGVTDPVRTDDVAEALGIPRNYLSKTMHALARGGVLSSTRGPRGGYRLAEPADRTPLARIVGVFDPAEGRDGCLLRPGPCDDADPCAAHHLWRPVERAVRTFFRDTTLADLMGDGPASNPDPRTEP